MHTTAARATMFLYHCPANMVAEKTFIATYFIALYAVDISAAEITTADTPKVVIQSTTDFAYNALEAATF